METFKNPKRDREAMLLKAHQITETQTHAPVTHEVVHVWVQACMCPSRSCTASDHPSVQLASQVHLCHFLRQECLLPDSGRCLLHLHTNSVAVFLKRPLLTSVA